jgi:hypothetical protein
LHLQGGGHALKLQSSFLGLVVEHWEIPATSSSVVISVVLLLHELRLIFVG